MLGYMKSLLCLFHWQLECMCSWHNIVLVIYIYMYTPNCNNAVIEKGKKEKKQIGIL